MFLVVVVLAVVLAVVRWRLLCSFPIISKFSRVEARISILRFRAVLDIVLVATAVMMVGRDWVRYSCVE